MRLPWACSRARHAHQPARQPEIPVTGHQHPTDESAAVPLRLGVSACLLGQRVRYNGGHKRDSYVMGTLDRVFTWVPVCPEIEVGMGVPRPVLRLVGTPDATRMITTNSGEDWTERMQRYARKRVRALSGMGLHGYILKSRSPSCGMERVKIYSDKGMPTHSGSGLFAAELQHNLHPLPIEEEGRLNDERIRESFITRVFCYYRWQTAVAAAGRAAALVSFHAQHKYLIMAYSPAALKELGQITASIKKMGLKTAKSAYRDILFETLRKPPTPRRHRNAMNHIAGHFRKILDAEDRQELHETIEASSNGAMPRLVPLTLLRHHARRHRVDYILDQVYLFPHPDELALLNHA